MADPLGITAGIVGISAATLHSVRILLGDLYDIQGAPKVIDSVKRDLSAVHAALESLESQNKDVTTRNETNSLFLSPSLVEAMGHCRETCSTFQAALKSWLKHSTEGEMSRRDRINIGVFKMPQVLAFARQLEACKGTFTMAVTTTNLLKQHEAGQATEEMKNKVLANEHDIIQQKVQLSDRIEGLDNELKKLTIQDEEQHVTKRNSEESDSANEILHERDLLKQCQDVCEAALSRLSEHTGVSIEDVKSTNEAMLAAGLFNADGLEKGVNLNIKGVSADSKGKVIVGIARGMDINKFFG
ncbi:hypothetical protein P7C71_g5165, partial [Lecanoromycetidae sp. Uapishka_2]